MDVYLREVKEVPVLERKPYRRDACVRYLNAAPVRWMSI